MMKYIKKYQNNYTSFYLFNLNFQIILEKGIDVSGILDSNIFTYQIDYEEWPSTHTDNSRLVEPFNDSIFNIRNQYHKIFNMR